MNVIINIYLLLLIIILLRLKRNENYLAIAKLIKIIKMPFFDDFEAVVFYFTF